MICPKCKGTMAYTKCIEVSSDMETKGMDEEVAGNKFIDEGNYSYEYGVDMLCSNCVEETFMEEETIIKDGGYNEEG